MRHAHVYRYGGMQMYCYGGTMRCSPKKRPWSGDVSMVDVFRQLSLKGAVLLTEPPHGWQVVAAGYVPIGSDDTFLGFAVVLRVFYLTVGSLACVRVCR